MIPPPDLHTSLESSLGERYSIERELGGGGMARVFLATERALGRRVVIKVLSQELAAEVSSKRFEREIRLAASLQQANIVPVLATGETDGLPHYTMPFVEGLSLRQRLERPDRPTIGETVSILRDVARALAYAHERGVVHRDIKPENVLLSGDAAVVTDFGIAKAIATARRDGAAPHRDSTVTIAGTAVGTPAYMAPEQISADPSIDHRADIYSFGCLAYELLTGQVPFTSSLTHALFAAHISEAPTPVFEKNPDTPPALGMLVMRCLEKDPVNRPQSAREILPILESSTAQSTGVRRLVRRLSRRQRLAVAGAVALAAAVVVVASVRGAIMGPGTRAQLTVAVIPFLNTGGDSADEYLADGMADGLATGLGKVPGVTVVSRSLGYRFKGQRALDAQEVGRALAAAYVVHGSVRRVGEQLRVSAQLVRASDRREIWSQNYDRSAADAFAVQDEISRLVVAALPQTLLGGRPAAVIASAARSGTTDPVAYDLYLRGRFLLQRRAVRAAAQLFEQAVQHDTNFAAAHASLALALELRPYFEAVNARTLGGPAIASARRALSIDSTLAEAHTALAMAHQHLYEWTQAEAAYRRAVALNPNEPDAHIQFGRFLFYTGQSDEAVAAFERARSLDPLSPVASGWVGHMHHLAGRHQQGLVEIERAIALDSNNAPSLVFYSQLLTSMGRREQARAVAEHLWNVVPAWRGPASAALREAGDSTKWAARSRVADAAGVDGPLANYRQAMQHAANRDTMRMFDALERATDSGEIWPTYTSLSEHTFDFARRHPRFAAVVRSVGLDDRIFTSANGGRPR